MTIPELNGGVIADELDGTEQFPVRQDGVDKPATIELVADYVADLIAAYTPIASLGAAGALADADLFRVSQSGTEKKAALSELITYVMNYLDAHSLHVTDFSSDTADINGQMVSTSVRINQAGGTPPVTGGTLSATDYLGNNGQVLTNPDQWITLNLSGQVFVLPAYNPGP